MDGAAVVRRGAGIVAAVALTAWAALSLVPLDVALTRFLADDTFYYLAAARWIVAGGPPSLDGVHVTNGFHPLWMLVCCLLTPLSAVHPLLPLRGAILLSALLFAVTLVLLHRAAARGLPDPLPALFLALLAVSWRLASVPLVTLETALAGCLSVVLVTVAIERPPATAAQAARFGLLAALTALARFDQLPLSGLAIAWLLVTGEGDVAVRARRTAVAGAAAAVTLLPWLA